MTFTTMLTAFGLIFVTTASAQNLECPEIKVQDFLKHEFVKNAPDSDAALKTSLQYRILNYGHFPDGPYHEVNPVPVGKYIREVTFLGLPAKINRKIVGPLSCVEKAIQADCQLTPYDPENLSSLRTVNSYRGGELSNHLFGIAIDLDPALNPCCGCVKPWSDNPVCRIPNQTAWDRTIIPACYIKAFERFGFYWLGRDPDLQDTMHFEFLGRPPMEKDNKDAAACPDDMVLVKRENSSFCVDRFEAPNRQGEKPFVARTALEGEAYCKTQDKELCSDIEWEQACKGLRQTPFPYGPSYKEGVCNDDKVWRSPSWPLVARYNPANPDSNPAARDHINYLNQSEASGKRLGCVSDEGVFDLTGNVAEWVRNTRKIPSNADGVVNGHNIKGCYWSKCYQNNRPSCAFTNPNHASGFRSYETGFRCCRKAAF